MYAIQQHRSHIWGKVVFLSAAYNTILGVLFWVLHLVVTGPCSLSLASKSSQNLYFTCLDNQSIVSVKLKLGDIVSSLGLLSSSGSTVVQGAGPVFVCANDMCK